MMDDKGKLKLKGVSHKILKRIKLEAINCPVLIKEVGFVIRSERIVDPITRGGRLLKN